MSPDQRVLTLGEQGKQVAGVPGVVARIAAPAVRGVNRKSRTTRALEVSEAHQNTRFPLSRRPFVHPEPPVTNTFIAASCWLVS